MMSKKVEKHVKKLTKQLKEFMELFSDEVTNTRDFSKWIGTNGSILIIKGEKYLWSFSDGDIAHTDIYQDVFNKGPKYEIVTFNDLKLGDVYIEDEIHDPQLHDFEIFIGKDNGGFYKAQYLYNQAGIEHIDTTSHRPGFKDVKVKRFLRK